MAAFGLLGAVGLLGGCTRGNTPDGGTGVPAPVTARTVSLVRVGDCGELLNATKRRMTADLARRTAGFDGAGRFESGTGAVTADRAIGRAPATSTAADPGGSTPADGAEAAAGQVVAGTNNQEAGVDEADLVKTDGRRIVSVIGGVLRLVTLDASPAVDGTLDLGTGAGDAPAGAQMFLRGNEAVVIGDTAGRDGSSGTQIMRVDLTDPATPRVVERTTVDGQVTASRMIDSRIRVVLRSSPEAVTQAMSLPTEAARAATRRLTATDLLPRRVDPSGSTRTLGGCRDVLVAQESTKDDAPVTAPPESGTPSEVTVLTIGATLSDLAPVTVSGDVQAVYAGTTALYVTSPAWTARGATTVVHRFDLTGTGPAVYTGSGFTPGSLLNQYSMSDRGGDLRVVTTTEAGVRPAVEGAAPGATVEPGGIGVEATPVPAPVGSGRLAVLRPNAAGTLVEVGRLDDLGRGEQVKSVRFLDDRAYVVTFRRTDPLFAVDLADPTAPRLLGRLTIPGFSEYLHPVGDGLLLGIGSDADPTGGQVLGFKASLFDVRDPTAPRELDSFTLAGAVSPVGADPRSFTWDPVRAQAVVPIDSGGFPNCPPNAICDSFGVGPAAIDRSARPAVLVIGVAGDRLTVRGALIHQRGGPASPILRSVVVDDNLWTLSDLGLGRSSATDPTTLELLPF